MKRFQKFGDLEQAAIGTENVPVKLLLSHDPSHWRLKALDSNYHMDITFAGHTHGAQFGIEIPGWRWSPVNLRYKQWGGIYKKKKQILNVNTGIGFIGFPGRIGMPPEVGLITLKKA